MYMIYGVSDCPHCLRAQALCMENDVDYAWVMMDWSKDYREHIKSDWKWNTYPIITKMSFTERTSSEVLVGGFDELQLELLSLDQQHTYYVDDLSPGDLVRWIIDYRVFEARDNGEVFPVDAIWAYGIIIEISGTDPYCVAIVRLDTKTHQFLHMIHDGFEIISKANGD